jgi:hypothetical protein
VYGLNDEVLDSEKAKVPMRALGPVSAVQGTRLIFKASKIDAKSTIKKVQIN